MKSPFTAENHFTRQSNWVYKTKLLKKFSKYLLLFPTSPFSHLGDSRKSQQSLKLEPLCLQLGTIKAVNVLRAFSLEACDRPWGPYERKETRRAWEDVYLPRDWVLHEKADLGKRQGIQSISLSNFKKNLMHWSKNTTQVAVSSPSFTARPRNITKSATWRPFCRWGQQREQKHQPWKMVWPMVGRNSEFVSLQRNTYLINYIIFSCFKINHNSHP